MSTVRSFPQIAGIKAGAALQAIVCSEQRLRSTAAALQAVQKAAGDVSNAQKTLQSGGTVVATPTPTPSAPPTLNINIPGLGGNQAPAGVTYTPGTQATQVSSHPLYSLPCVQPSRTLWLFCHSCGCLNGYAAPLWPKRCSP